MGWPKLKSTYTDKLPLMIKPQTGRVHTSYHQAVAATGRLSSTDPNLQNIPVRWHEQGRRIRQAFIPCAGYKLVAADLPRSSCAWPTSGDKGLLTLRRGQGTSKATAAGVRGRARCGDQRHAPQCQGDQLWSHLVRVPSGLAKQLGSVAPAQKYMDLYLSATRVCWSTWSVPGSRRMPRLSWRLCLPSPLSAGYKVSQRGPDARQPNGPPSTPLYAGTAADIIKRAMDQRGWLDPGH